MEYHEYCEHVQKHYPRLHPHLYGLREDFFAPAFWRAAHQRGPAGLRVFAEPIHPGVYAFDMLTPRFCREMLQELDHFEKWMAQEDLPVIRPNTMNNYGAVLDTFGFAPMLDQLMRVCVSPFASLLYPEVGGGSLDGHHGFIVEYALGKDVDLGFHVDVSEVTLNVCLGEQFSGGTLYFEGVRCGLCQQTEPLPGESFEVEHSPGRAILHRGNHRHGANPIAAGRRLNLILWCYSSNFDRRQSREHRPEWCNYPSPPTPCEHEGQTA
jgi:hypothetical protein